MNSNSDNQMTTQSIFQDGLSKMGLALSVALLSLNFTQLFPYVLLIISSVLAGYFLCKMRDESKEKVVVNEKINFFESMIHESDDTILLYNIECRKYQYVNRAFGTNFKLSLKELNAIEHPKFINITNIEFEDMIANLVKGTQSSYKFEVKMLKSNGSEGSFNATLERIIIDSKNFAELTLREITEVKTQVAEMSQHIDNYEDLIQQYKNSNREMEEYAAMLAAHDLQKPIQQILTDIQELESESWFKLDMTEKESVHSIRDHANSLSTMLQDVIAFSTVGSNTTFLEMNPMSALVQDVLNQLRPKIKESDALIEVAQLPEMLVDSRQIKHLFKNLIENAIDNRGDVVPEILIGCTKENEQWRISISDNCGAIENTSQEKVFETFWRLNNEEEGRKSGINLAICKKIINNHEGTIGLESEREEGSTIFFTIPMSTSDQMMYA